MTQYARPNSDITTTGIAGGTWDSINESSASDADFVYGDENTAVTYEFGLTDPSDPNVHTAHIYSYRLAKLNGTTVDTGGNAVVGTMYVYCGGTLIATDTGRTAGEWTTYSGTLSEAQAANITNYADLRLRLYSPASGGNATTRRAIGLSWAEFSLPDAPVNITVAEAVQEQVVDAAVTHAMTPITVAEAVQLQVMDAAEASMQQPGGDTYNITVAEAVQLQVIDEVVARGLTPITAAEAVQLQVVDAATVTATTPISPAEAYQLQIVDAASVTSGTPPVNITVAEAYQLQVVDAPTVTSVYPVTVSEAYQAQVVDAATVTAITPIAPAEAVQTQSVDAASVSAIHVLTIAEAYQLQIIDAGAVTYSAPGAVEYNITTSEMYQVQIIDGVMVMSVDPAPRIDVRPTLRYNQAGNGRASASASPRESLTATRQTIVTSKR